MTADTTPTVDFDGSGFTLRGLSIALEKLNQFGEVYIKNVKPGSVDIIELTVALQALQESRKK